MRSSTSSESQYQYTDDRPRPELDRERSSKPYSRMLPTRRTRWARRLCGCNPSRKPTNVEGSSWSRQPSSWARWQRGRRGCFALTTVCVHTCSKTVSSQTEPGMASANIRRRATCRTRRCACSSLANTRGGKREAEYQDSPRLETHVSPA
jgi:hypothetical protein